MQALAALGCTRLWLVLLEAFASAVAPAARARSPMSHDSRDAAGATAAAERAASSKQHRPSSQAQAQTQLQLLTQKYTP